MRKAESERNSRLIRVLANAPQASIYVLSSCFSFFLLLPPLLVFYIFYINFRLQTPPPSAPPTLLDVT